MPNNPRINIQFSKLPEKEGRKNFLSRTCISHERESQLIAAATTSWKVLLLSNTMELRPLTLSQTHSSLVLAQAHSTVISLVLKKDNIYTAIGYINPSNSSLFIDQNPKLKTFLMVMLILKDMLIFLRI